MLFKEIYVIFILNGVRLLLQYDKTYLLIINNIIFIYIFINIITKRLIHKLLLTD